MTPAPDRELAVVRAFGVAWTVLHRVAEARVEAFSADPEASYRVYTIDLRDLPGTAVDEAIGAASRPVVDPQGTQAWIWDAVRRWVVVLGYPELRAAGPVVGEPGPPAGAEVTLSPGGIDLSATIGWSDGAGERTLAVRFDPGAGGWVPA